MKEDITQNLSVEIKKHFEEDRINFQRMDDQFKKMEDANTEQNMKLNTILVHIKTSNEFMENMNGINDVVKGVSLLKRPSLWLLALVIGMVALFGGFKSILAIFLPTK